MVIQSAAGQLFGQLEKARHLRGMDAQAFSQRAGFYVGEINVLHPFREGNGRTQREFIAQLAFAAGHRIDWSGIDQKTMVNASIVAYSGDSGHLAQIIQSTLRA